MEQVEARAASLVGPELIDRKCRSDARPAVKAPVNPYRFFWRLACFFYKNYANAQDRLHPEYSDA